MENKKNYSIGLDIGTSSVGYAVINTDNFKLIKKGNKRQSMWGVRLFETASTAESRRLSRGTRRRYDRRRQRIKLLQEEFNNEINKVDNKFFQKLRESFYQEEDKINKTIILSKEEKELIKKYHGKFPTIYHLRKYLLETKEKVDIRLVYIAMHHMIKYRGNFLYNQQSFNLKELNINDKLKELISIIENNSENIELIDSNIPINKFEEIIEIKSKLDRKNKLKIYFEKLFDKKIAAELSKMLIGNQFQLSKIFNIEIEEVDKVSFEGTQYEEEQSKIESQLGSEFLVLEVMKELYNSIFLKDLFKGSNETSLSKIMVNRYQQHKKDLKYLKDILKIDRVLYNKMFRNIESKKKTELCIYQKYISNKLTYEEFIKEADKLREIAFDNNLSINLINEYNNRVKSSIESKEFLPRITNTDNGKYPYQLNKDELLTIIENQSKYYPFLLKETKDKTKKIVKLLEFRIPYYVGPLNNTTKEKGVKNKNAWLIKKQENVKITPYNFFEVIDKEKTAEEFIVRMLSNCTYLLSEKAMASNSILYSKFKVLNEIKQIKVNDERLSLSQIDEVYNELFLKNSKTITEKDFIKYLMMKPDFKMYSEIKVTGYSAEKKFANSMKTYVDFFGENGIFENTKYTISDAENIIKYITIFEDKSILKEKVEKEYPNIEEEKVKAILNKKYTGWSNLSEKLLTGILYFDKQTNTSKSIINLMEETLDNFMQIINKKEYNFEELIAKENIGELKEELNYTVIEKLATSPANKRGIYQAMLVVKEIVDIMGYNPKNISIEMARGEEEKKRKDAKKDFLIKLYEQNKKEIAEYNGLIKELKSLEKVDTKKLFLYFIQEGKSLYSGKPLDINKLNEYEIDHIIPRTLIKDNSIDNLALVLREENQIKEANYTLPEQYRNNHMKKWWLHLKSINLLSNKKFYSLTKAKYNSEDIEGFINRQIVETRQICKHVANILNNQYKKTNVVYLHANLTSNYREKFELFKFRKLNNLHHAKDAYLTACLGEYQYYYKKYTDFSNITNNSNNYSKEEKMNYFRYGAVINSINNKNIFADKDGEILLEVKDFIETVNKTMENNDIITSKKTEIRTGEFYNQTKNSKGKKGVNLKDNLDSTLYGSYTSLNPAYAVFIKYISKGKEKRKLVGVPIYYELKSQNDSNVKVDYLKNLVKADKDTGIEIIKDKIPFFSKLDWNGQICSLVGATDVVEVCNAKEFIIENKLMKKWEETFNRLLNNKKTEEKEDLYNNNLTEIINYIIKKVEKEYKLYNNLVENMKEYFIKENLTTENKEQIIKEMLKLLKCNSESANLKNIDGEYSSAFGRKHRKPIENFKLITTSITGIKSRKHEF